MEKKQTSGEHEEDKDFGLNLELLVTKLKMIPVMSIRQVYDDMPSFQVLVLNTQKYIGIKDPLGFCYLRNMFYWS